MAPHYNLNHASKRYPFMTCVVQVSAESYGQRTVAKVLNTCHGVHSFRMDDGGLVEISGTVDPGVLLKMLGKAGRSAKVCWVQSGECSSNLYMPTTLTGSGSRDGRYLQPTALSRPSLPSNHGYGGYNHVADVNHYYSNGNINRVFQLGYDDSHYHAHGYPYSYDDTQQTYHQYDGYGENEKARSRSSGRDEISCCTVM